jgi:hypothetical protein
MHEVEEVAGAVACPADLATGILTLAIWIIG